MVVLVVVTAMMMKIIMVAFDFVLEHDDYSCNSNDADDINGGSGSSCGVDDGGRERNSFSDTFLLCNW